MNWLWFNCKAYRDLRLWWFNYRFKRVAKFIVSHALWWNEEDKGRWERYINERS